MFEGLALNTNNITDPCDVSFEALYTAAIDLSLLDRAMESLQRATSLADAIEHLQVFNDVIVKFGLSRELLAFVDHDKTLSTAIPAIPSLESFLLDAKIDTTAANEAIVEKIKEATGKFYEAFKAHIVKYRAWYGTVAAVINFLNNFKIALILGAGTLDCMGGAMSVVEFGKKLLSARFLVPCIAYNVIDRAIRSAKSIPAAVNEVLKLKLPTTPEERKTYTAKVRSVFKSKAGINIDSLEEASISAGEGGEKPVNTLGYTAENIEKLVGDIKEIAAELKKGESVAAQLEALSKSPEAETAEGRSALVFVAGVVTKTMKLTVANATAAVHQLKEVGHAAIKGGKA